MATLQEFIDEGKRRGKSPEEIQLGVERVELSSGFEPEKPAVNRHAGLAVAAAEPPPSPGTDTEEEFDFLKMAQTNTERELARVYYQEKFGIPHDDDMLDSRIKYEYGEEGTASDVMADQAAWSSHRYVQDTPLPTLKEAGKLATGKMVNSIYSGVGGAWEGAVKLLTWKQEEFLTEMSGLAADHGAENISRYYAGRAESVRNAREFAQFFRKAAGELGQEGDDYYAGDVDPDVKNSFAGQVAAGIGELPLMALYANPLGAAFAVPFTFGRRYEEAQSEAAAAGKTQEEADKIAAIYASVYAPIDIVVDKFTAGIGKGFKPVKGAGMKNLAKYVEKSLLINTGQAQLSGLGELVVETSESVSLQYMTTGEVDYKQALTEGTIAYLTGTTGGNIMGSVNTADQVRMVKQAERLGLSEEEATTYVSNMTAAESQDELQDVIEQMNMRVGEIRSKRAAPFTGEAPSEIRLPTEPVPWTLGELQGIRRGNNDRQIEEIVKNAEPYAKDALRHALLNPNKMTLDELNAVLDAQNELERISAEKYEQEALERQQTPPKEPIGAEIDKEAEQDLERAERASDPEDGFDTFIPNAAGRIVTPIEIDNQELADEARSLGLIPEAYSDYGKQAREAGITDPDVLESMVDTYTLSTEDGVLTVTYQEGKGSLTEQFRAQAEKQGIDISQYAPAQEIEPENVPVGDWQGREMHHGTSQEGAASIIEGGIDNSQSTKGYFGRGFYLAVQRSLAESNYADMAEDEPGQGAIVTVTINPDAVILDLRDPKDSEIWMRVSENGKIVGREDFDQLMMDAGIDGLYDNSFGGVVIYNPDAVTVSQPEPESEIAPDQEATPEELASEELQAPMEIPSIYKEMSVFELSDYASDLLADGVDVPATLIDEIMNRAENMKQWKAIEQGIMRMATEKRQANRRIDGEKTNPSIGRFEVVSDRVGELENEGAEFFDNAMSDLQHRLLPKDEAYRERAEKYVEKAEHLSVEQAMAYLGNKSRRDRVSHLRKRLWPLVRAGDSAGVIKVLNEEGLSYQGLTARRIMKATGAYQLAEKIYQKEKGKPSLQNEPVTGLREDGNTATLGGRPFWSGSVSLLDGQIEEIHEKSVAEQAGWHHSLYFSEGAIERMDAEESAFFWVDDSGEIQIDWRGTPPPHIRGRIKAQLDGEGNGLIPPVESRRRHKIHPDQLSLDFDQETIPEQNEYDLTPEEAQLADAASRRAVGIIHRYGGTLLASNMVKSWQRGESGSLVGQKIETTEDLAAAAQIYRNPSFEVFRLIWVDEDTGQIMHEETISARLPNTSSIVAKKDTVMSWRARVNALSDKYGKFYAMHNHPSQNVSDSDGDRKASAWISQIFGDRYLGHLILNHQRYTYIKPSSSAIGGKKMAIDPSLLVDAPHQYHIWDSSDQYIPHKSLGVSGISLMSKAELAGIIEKTDVAALQAGSLATKRANTEDYFQVIATDVYGQIVSIATYPNSLLIEMDKKGAGGHNKLFAVLRAQQLLGMNFNMYAVNVNPKLKQNKGLRKGYRYNALSDIVFSDKSTASDLKVAHYNHAYTNGRDINSSTRPFVKEDGQPALIKTAEFAVTGEESLVVGYQGRGATPTEVYGEKAVAQGTAVPIMGPGQYVAFSEQEAEAYGKVRPFSVRIRNPLVIESDAQWFALLRDANANHLSSVSTERQFDPAGVLPATHRLQAYIQTLGHDGVIIAGTDQNKRLGESFGHDQAIVFEAKEETGLPPEKPSSSITHVRENADAILAGFLNRLELENIELTDAEAELVMRYVAFNQGYDPDLEAVPDEAIPDAVLDLLNREGGWNDMAAEIAERINGIKEALNIDFHAVSRFYFPLRHMINNSLEAGNEQTVEEMLEQSMGVTASRHGTFDGVILDPVKQLEIYLKDVSKLIAIGEEIVKQQERMTSGDSLTKTAAAIDKQSKGQELTPDDEKSLEQLEALRKAEAEGKQFGYEPSPFSSGEIFYSITMHQKDGGGREARNIGKGFEALKKLIKAKDSDTETSNWLQTFLEDQGGKWINVVDPSFVVEMMDDLEGRNEDGRIFGANSYLWHRVLQATRLSKEENEKHYNRERALLKKYNTEKGYKRINKLLSELLLESRDAREIVMRAKSPVWVEKQLKLNPEDAEIVWYYGQRLREFKADISYGNQLRSDVSHVSKERRARFYELEKMVVEGLANDAQIKEYLAYMPKYGKENTPEADNKRYTAKLMMRRAVRAWFEKSSIDSKDFFGLYDSLKGVQAQGGYFYGLSKEIETWADYLESVGQKDNADWWRMRVKSGITGDMFNFEDKLLGFVGSAVKFGSDAVLGEELTGSAWDSIRNMTVDSFKGRVVEGMQLLQRARINAYLVGNIGWSLATQPTSLSLTIKQAGWSKVFKALHSVIFGRNKNEIRDSHVAVIKGKRKGIASIEAIGEFEEHSTDKTKRQKLRNVMSAFGSWMEGELSYISFLAGEQQAKELYGANDYDAQVYGDFMAAKTQSMYDRVSRNTALNSNLMRMLRPMQSYVFTAFSNALDTAGVVGRKRSALVRTQEFARFIMAQRLFAIIWSMIFGDDLLKALFDPVYNKGTVGSNLPLVGDSVDESISKKLPWKESKSYLTEGPTDKFLRKTTRLAEAIVTGDENALRDAGIYMVDYVTPTMGIGGSSMFKNFIRMSDAKNSGYEFQDITGDKYAEFANPNNPLRWVGGAMFGIKAVDEGEKLFEEKEKKKDNRGRTRSRQSKSRRN